MVGGLQVCKLSLAKSVTEVGKYYRYVMVSEVERELGGRERWSMNV